MSICLVVFGFYRQYRIWRRKGAEWADFTIAHPLWVFFGKTVTGGSKAAQATRSDVILDFLDWVLARREEMVPALRRLLEEQSDLVDDGKEFFAGRFDDINSEPLARSMETFVGHYFTVGRLHVQSLTTGKGERHLRAVAIHRLASSISAIPPRSTTFWLEE